jgi:hypothetical protein
MANLGPAPKAQFITASGEPIVGGKVYTYAAGTTTPLQTYTDSSATSANANPVILDARGEASIWFGPNPYKIKLTDSVDVEIWTVDNVSGIIGATSPAFTGNVTVTTNSASPAVQITQTGSGQALLIEDTASPDATPFVVTADGRVGVGTNAPAQSLDVATGLIQLSDGISARTQISATALASTFAAVGARDLILKTNNTDRVYLSGSTGYLGVGIPSPTVAIDVSGTIQATTSVNTNTISPRTAGVGVTIDGVLCQNSVVYNPAVISASNVQSTTSGTSFNFSNIPSWVKRVTVILKQVSLSGTDTIYIRVGPSSGVVGSGYVSACARLENGATCATITNTAAFIINSNSASSEISGIMTINKIDSSSWVAACHGNMGTGPSTFAGGGFVTLSGDLANVQLSASGANTFDGGLVNIFYE